MADWSAIGFDLAPTGLALFTLDGRATRINRAFAGMLGYLPDELLDANFLRLTHPDDVGLSQAFWERFDVHEGALSRMEKRYLHRNGEAIWAELAAALVRDPNGVPLHFVVSVVDASARKGAEEALRTSEYFFKESQRVANIGSYHTDFVTGSWQSSEVLDAIFGIDRTFVRSVAAWLQLVHPDEQASLERYLTEEVAAQRKPFNREYRIVRHSDGATRWVSGRGEVTFADDGKLLSMIGTIQDVTDRKDAEAASRLREQRHRAILATAMDGFWLTNTTGQLVEANETYAQMSGYTVAELRTMRIPDLEAHERPEEVAAHMDNVMRVGQDRFESRHRRKDGSVFDVEISVQYRPDDEGAIVVFVRDISAKKRAEAERESLEAQLRQAQKMESVGRLAGGIAHDFNNMLAAILGYSELALGQVEPGTSIHSDLTEIGKAAERSAELTRQLLAFARKQTVAPKVMDLNQTVEGVRRILQRLAGEEIELLVRPGSDLWPVRMDPSQLDEVLVNLCVNSRDAIVSHGRITITTENVTLSAAETLKHAAAAGDYVCIRVRDTGTGMSEEVLSHMFEPFFTTKLQGKGTGLGLATAYGAIRQNDGFIEVQSSLGQGTTFTICLPRHRGPAEQRAKASSDLSISVGQETILVVEDEPSILALLQHQLQRLGYTVLATSSPGQAVALAKSHPGRIHLLVTDVVMPEMNGRELSLKILSAQPRLQCLFMSGYTAEVIASRGVLDEGVHFLQKPFTAKVVADRVRAAIDSGHR